MRKKLLIAAGTVSLGLGVVGIFVPLLPTTPFLLLAAGCYARSSQRLLEWLLTRPRLGDYIRRYREGRGLTAGTKALTLLFLWVVIAISALTAVESEAARVVLVLIAGGVTVHILSRPTDAG